MKSPLKAWNLGSKAADAIDLTREGLYSRLGSEELALMFSVPLFLANPGQIDFLSPDWLKRDDSRPCVVGLYVRKRKQQEWLEQLLALGGDHLEGGAKKVLEGLAEREGFILISPEKLLMCSGSTGAPMDLVFDKVLYHELAHAYMDSAPAPDEDWGHTLEESLANSWALQFFRSPVERAWVLRIIKNSPPQYKGAILLSSPHLLEHLLQEGYQPPLLSSRWADLLGFSPSLDPLALIPAWRRSKPLLSSRENVELREFWKSLGAALLNWGERLV